MQRRFRPQAWLLLLGCLVLLLVVAVLLSRLWVEWAWFAQFGWQSVLARRWLVQLVGALLGLGLGLVLQRWLLRTWRLPVRIGEPLRFALAGPRYLAVLLSCAALQVLPLLLVLELAKRLWLDPFDPRRLHGLVLLTGGSWLSLLVVSAVVVLALLVRPLSVARLLGATTACAVSIALGRAWGIWTLALMIPDQGIRDPILQADVSFALARFPAVALALTVAMALLMVHLGAALWGLLARSPQLSDGRFAGFSEPQLHRLRPPMGLLALCVAAAFWLGRHQLLLSADGAVPGASWVDVHVALPLRSLAALLALLTGAVLLLPMPPNRWRTRAWLSLAAATLVMPLVETVAKPVLQLLFVNPQELKRERPYLARSIRYTRLAFQLDRISSRDVNPRPRLTRADVQASAATLRNIRLWDSQPLLATNRQLQQLRVFYRFSEPAVDRYALSQNRDIGRQQVMVAAREMDSSALPASARTWLNRHLVFTHGQGFTVSPVNTSGPDGLPEYFISDLGRSSRVQGSRQLGITRNAVLQGIPVGLPSLYYGALSAPYVLAPTAVLEFNYPEGDKNFYSRYSGRSGIPVGTTESRLAAALYLGEPRLLSRGALRPDTRLLLRRDVRQLLRHLAPFVRFEVDPYLVSVALPPGNGVFVSRNRHQYWIVDGFTTSRTYPYSAPVSGEPDIRYIRNAVKAVVDAYDGRVALYVSDADDPLIRGWQRLFPELFRPLSAMPLPLMQHLRYPIRQFEIQTRQLLRYHVTDPRVFYSGDDVWQVPKEIYGNQQVPLKPYHISAQLSPGLPPEFLLLQPLTPLARPNLVAWLAARSDAPHYGELVLLRFPSQTPIFGPEQITALINQDPRISEQFGLWSQSGSEVIQGNLLVVPIGKALLYVEPVYLQARNGGLPTLTAVVVSDGSRIVMEATLAEAIDALLDPHRSRPLSRD
ncbi:MAG: hypothetical protein RLZZ336_584 [Cyanobacteriota bacterium]|jgi:uncharacterized membrane protein (UPF0182 family)